MGQAKKSGKPPKKANGSPPQRTPNPRHVALDLFRLVLDQQRPLDGLLGSHRLYNILSDRDRAFVRRLVATLLRRLGQVDQAISHCLAKPLSRRQGDLQNLLRLGAVQLLFLETPPHAAVSTTMDLAQHPRLAGQKNLINAILRRLAREGVEIVKTQDAARLNTPDWLWHAWRKSFGEDQTRRIATAHLSEAPLDLSLKGPSGEWQEELGAELLPGGSLRLMENSGDISQLPGFADGAWWVQDFAAALPARLLGAIPDQVIADLCAAPGGKTAFLALTGAKVLAVDKSKARLRRLEENLGRLKLTAEAILADVSNWHPEEKLDGVLLDAPCSATGTLRRHPDVAHLKDPNRIATLVDLQAHLLRQAVKMVKPGGVVVYAVCSLQAEEGPDQIERLLADQVPVKRIPIEAVEVFGLKEVITDDGDLRTLPCHLADRGGMDGFYACRLQTN
ncbi:MAG: 16S rRNA (cytosine(967)-C(5))-methyltransferase RsmB [Pseudomonadota bacterium]